MQHDLATDFVDRLRAFVRRRLPSAADAEDVLQTVLLRLVERRSDVPGQAVHGWLFAVARSTVADFYRRHRHLPQSLADTEVEGQEPPLQRELAGCLEPLLRELTPADRDLLRRVDVDGESQAALARQLGLSPSGLKSRVQRARARLRATLEACCDIEIDGRGLPTNSFRARRPDDPCRCD